MSVGFIFSGQGAQFVGMGKDLCESSHAAAEIFAEADDVLGWSISDICFNGPEEKLKESIYCQPAIYTMSVACLAAFKEKNPTVKPSAVGGLSLGEYASLYAAGVFTFADGLRFLEERTIYMDEGKKTQGGMASVLGGDIESIKKVCDEIGIDVANYNCPGQVVISGDKEKVLHAVAELKEREIKGLKRALPLKVAGAFHSKLMFKAGEKLMGVVSDTKMNSPKCDLMQNFTGSKVYKVEEIRDNLVHQVAGSVRWEDCVKNMIANGVDSFIEFGPGKVLTGLVKRIDRSVALSNVSSSKDIG